MNFNFNLKKYLVLGLVGLGVVIGDSSAHHNKDQYKRFIENALVNSVVDYKKVRNELVGIKNSLTNVINNNPIVWKQLFSAYEPQINNNVFSSWLTVFCSKFFDNFKIGTKSIEYNSFCTSVCMEILSIAKVVSIIRDYNSKNDNKISLPQNSSNIISDVFLNLTLKTSEIDNFIDQYKNEYKSFDDCGVLGVLEYLINNFSSSSSADQYVTFLKSIIKNNRDGIVTKTINSKVDCSRYSFFPFSDDKKSESINTLLQDDNVNIKKVLSLLEEIGYSKKMTTSEAWLLSKNPKLDAVTELTNEKLVEARKLGSSAELYDWISKQSTTGRPPVVPPNDDSGTKDPGKDGEEQGGNDPEDKGGDGFVYVKGLSDKLDGKKLKITSTENKPVVSGHSTEVKLDANLTVDKVIAELSKGNNVVINMRGVSRRGLYSIMLKSIGTAYRGGENGWSNTKNNFCNITLAS